MRNSLSMLAVVCAGVLVVVEASPQPARKTRPATVGEFAVRISTALGHENPTPEDAVLDLRKRGIDLGAGIGATLTEGVAARAMADLGFSVVMPAEPAAPVSESRAGYLAGTIASLGAPGVSPEAIGSSAGSSILQCLQAPNSGLCTQCCIDSLPDRFPTGIAAQICTRICAFNTPPPSPSSP